MTKLSQFSQPVYARWILLAIIIFTLPFILSIKNNLRFGNEYESLFPQGEEDTDLFFEHRELFGTENDFILIGIPINSSSDRVKFSQTINDLTEQISGLENCETVLSQFNGYSLFNSELLTGKDNSSAIYVKTKDGLSNEECIRLVGHLESILSQAGLGETYLAGRCVGQAGYLKMMESDMSRFLILSLLLIIISLFLIHRSIWGVVLPVIVLVVSIIWSLGVIAITGEPINIILTTLPTIIIIVGLSDIVHFVTRYSENTKLGLSTSDNVAKTISDIGLPMLLTSLTTGLGFFSLVLSNSSPINIFGIYTSISVILTFFISIILISVFLVIIQSYNYKHNTDHFLNKFLRITFRWTIKNQKFILVTATGVLVICVFFIFDLKENNFILEDTRGQNSVKEGFDFFETHFSGVRPFEMNLRVKNEDKTILDPEVLEEIGKVEFYLHSQYGVKNINSPRTIISRYQLSTFGTNYSDAFSKDLESYVSENRKVGRISGLVGDWGSQKFAQLNIKLEKYMNQNIDSTLLSGKLTGMAYMLDQSNSRISKNLILGLVMAIIFISLLIAFVFKASRIVIAVLLTNLFPLVVIGGILGIIGVEYKYTMSIVFSVGFGIAIDDTIHFISRFRSELGLGKRPVYALKRTYLSTGKALFVTTGILTIGFCTLLFSNFYATYFLGLLVSMTLIIALIGDMFLLPVLLIILSSSGNKGYYGKYPK